MIGLILYIFLFYIELSILTFILNIILPLFPFRIIPEWIIIPFVCAATACAYLCAINTSSLVCNKISRKPNATISVTDIVLAIIILIELIYNLVFNAIELGFTDCNIWAEFMVMLFMIYRLWSEIKIINLPINHMDISFFDIVMPSFSNNVSFGFNENFISLVFIATFILNIIF